MNQGFTIRECLRGYTNEALQEMCRHWRLAAGTKPNRIKALEKVLRDPLHVRDALACLSPESVRLLNLLAERGSTRAADVLSVFGLYGDGGTGRAMREVVRCGLALVSPQGGSGAFSFSRLRRDIPHADASPQVFVPELVAANMPSSTPIDVGLAPLSKPVQPDGRTGSEWATGAVLEVLRIAELHSPRVTAAGRVHRSDLAKAQQAAREAGVSPEALALGLMMARGLGCVAAKGGRLTTSDRAEQWASRSGPERMRDLFRAFVTSEELTELETFFPQLFEEMAEHLQPGSLRRTYHKTLAATAVAGLDAGSWYDVAGFAEAIRTLDRNVLFLDEQWRAIRAHARGNVGAWKQRAWEMHERRYYEWLVRTVLSGLGMVELGGGGARFRITETGQYALGVRRDQCEAPAQSEVLSEADHALVVQPDFEVIAYLDRCPPDLRRKLDTFAERLRGGVVSTYRLTRESVYRGVRTGSSVDEIAELLSRHTRHGLPENVRKQLGTWQRKLDSITIRTNCRIVECRSAREADRLTKGLSDTSRLGSRFVLSRDGLPEGTLRVRYDSPIRPCVVQGPGLELRAPWDQADLFVGRRLGDLGDVARRANGDLLVTLSPATVAREEDWPMAVALLEALVKEPLAARYRAALRAWCGDGAAGRSRSAPLIRFGDAETCEAALELTDAPELIEGRLGLYTLVVRQGKLAKLKKRLKEHGIPVVRSEVAWDDGAPRDWPQEQLDGGEPDREDQPMADSIEPETASLGEEVPTLLPSYSPHITREILDDAIERRRPVLIAYQSAWRSQPVVRRVNPVSVDISGRTPTFSGYCHLHKGSRAFKLAQIRGIRILEDEPF